MSRPYRVHGISLVYGDEQVIGDYATRADAVVALREAKAAQRREPRDSRIGRLTIDGPTSGERLYSIRLCDPEANREWLIGVYADSYPHAITASERGYGDHLLRSIPAEHCALARAEGLIVNDADGVVIGGAR